MAALFGSWESMQDLSSIDDLLDRFNVDETVWRKFEVQIGSRGADLRLLAALGGWMWQRSDGGRTFHADLGDSGGACFGD
jgi:hypothetical protein